MYCGGYGASRQPTPSAWAARCGQLGSRSATGTIGLSDGTSAGTPFVTVDPVLDTPAVLAFRTQRPRPGLDSAWSSEEESGHFGAPRLV